MEFEPTIKELNITVMGKMMILDVNNTEYHFPITKLNYLKLKKENDLVYNLQVSFANQLIEVFVQEWQEEGKYDSDCDVWSCINSIREALAVGDDFNIGLVMSLEHHGYNQKVRTLDEFKKMRST